MEQLIQSRMESYRCHLAASRNLTRRGQVSLVGYGQVMARLTKDVLNRQRVQLTRANDLRDVF